VSASQFGRFTDKQRERQQVAFGVSLLVCLVVSFGGNTPMFRLMPLSSQIVPDRVLNYASLLQCMLASLAIVRLAQWVTKQSRRPSAYALGVLIASIVLWVVYADCRTYLRLGGMQDYSLLKSLVARIPHDGVDPFNQGRLSIITYDWVSAANYFPAVDKIGLIDGWNQEGTTHQEVMIEQNIAASYGFWDYHLRNYALRNVRSVIAREDQDPELVALLKREGFYESERNLGISLYLSDKPSNYAFDMTNSMLAVGRGSLWASVALPWVSRGRQESLLAYDPDYLAQYPAVFIDEPAMDPGSELERAIRNLVAGGKTVIVDLSNSPVASLFGVTKKEIAISGEATFNGASDSQFPRSQVLNVTRADGAELRGAVYGDLDGVLLTVRFEGEDYPVVGYRDVPEGKVYFVGMGSTRSVIDTENEKTAGLFAPLFDSLDVRKTISPPAFPISKPEWNDRGLSFSYSSSETKPVLLSVTYTQRWTLTIDGQPAPIFNHEDFVYLCLPSGAHQISLEYGMSWVGFVGIAVTALGVMIVVLGSMTWARGVGRLELILRLGADRLAAWSAERISS
ncbi:MAG: 6-pyruvoyl-tetrahydropterin synthase-related protein, partial [Bacillota bacterium]